MSDTFVGAMIGLIGALVGGLIVAIPQYFQTKRQNEQWFAQFHLPNHLEKIGELYAALLDFRSVLSDNTLFLNPDPKYADANRLANPAITDYLEQINKEVVAANLRFDRAFAQALPYIKNTKADSILPMVRAALFLVSHPILHNTSPTSLRHSGTTQPNIAWDDADKAISNATEALGELLNPPIVQHTTALYYKPLRHAKKKIRD